VQGNSNLLHDGAIYRFILHCVTFIPQLLEHTCATHLISTKKLF